jgi:hypothetical protein
MAVMRAWTVASSLRLAGLATVVEVVACAGLGGEPDRLGPLEYPPGDTEASTLECTLGVGDPGCSPPQVLIVLDRSSSMVLRPDGSFPEDTATALAESKWTRAIEAIEAVISSSAGVGVAFGIELFPRDPGEGGCATVADVMERAPRLTAACRPGALIVPPCIGVNYQVAAALDPATTTICGDTPVAGALTVARDTLAAMKNSAQEQFILLVTDGGDTCDWDASSMEVAWDLQRNGVGIFAVGFGGYGVDPVVLSELTCAGGTAPEPDVTCEVDEGGNARWNPDADFTYLVAEDGARLEEVMSEIAVQVGCVVIR